MTLQKSEKSNLPGTSGRTSSPSTSESPPELTRAQRRDMLRDFLMNGPTEQTDSEHRESSLTAEDLAYSYQPVIYPEGYMEARLRSRARHMDELTRIAQANEARRRQNK